MNRRFLLVTALVASLFLAAGLLVLDIPLAHWIHASDFENAGLFVHGLDLLDVIFGVRVWLWLATCVCVALGLLGVLFPASLRMPRGLAALLLTCGLTQAVSLGLMVLGKHLFGRMRPIELFASGDWTTLWFTGGGSFPSGHAAFYFGLFLPLAAFAPRAWQRLALVAVPVFVAVARMDMSKHFLSDVSASALIAAAAALLMIPIMRRVSPAQ